MARTLAERRPYPLPEFRKGLRTLAPAGRVGAPSPTVSLLSFHDCFTEITFPYSSLVTAMTLPQRKHLPHDIPLFVNVSQEVYFITICCAKRGRNQLAIPSQASRLLQSVVHQNSRNLWCTHLFLIMPDHVHGLFSFASNGRPLKETVRLWKHWTAGNLKVEWQRDFFEHRLRKEESRRDKADYILHNPVRAGLVTQPDQWPYVWWPDVDGQMVSWPNLEPGPALATAADAGGAASLPSAGISQGPPHTGASR